MGQVNGSCPGVRDVELCAKLILEEAHETTDALEAGNLVDVIDGLCDLLYVAFGAAAACGVDLEPFYEEIHRTNMLKTSGPVREDGKRLKPKGWQPPRIAEILEGRLPQAKVDSEDVDAEDLSHQPPRQDGHLD
jgi:predicted HAD superfamily Cof-like phosphohydrolase